MEAECLPLSGQTYICQRRLQIHKVISTNYIGELCVISILVPESNQSPIQCMLTQIQMD
jgi:hypothetical protein